MTLLITNAYPSNERIYSNGFVHTRVLQYKQKNINLKVIVYKPKSKVTSYYFEGVEVTVVDKDGLIKLLQEMNYDSILIHFAYKEFTKLILKYKHEYSNVYIWIHGVEALSIKRRKFNFDNSIISFLKYVYLGILNKIQLSFMRNLILEHKKHRVHFIFVSNWMKDVMKSDTNCEHIDFAYTIIPNPIETSLFTNEIKDPSLRCNILNIRPYHSHKYANDITRDVIIELSKKPYFKDLKFTLIGDGKLMKEIVKPLEKFDNVEIKKGFITREAIKQTHDEHGVMLIPTRQDAQGVSMCEAICSGLVVITSDNTAIPEFASTQYAYLCNNVQDYVNAIENLYYNSSIFKEKNKNTKILSEKLGYDKIIDTEIRLFTSKCGGVFRK